MRKFLAVILVVVTISSLSGCGYNTLQSRDEKVKAAWSQVLSLYQKRYDLVPNLVSVVQGYASHEKEVLVKVTEARASVGSVKLPEKMTEDDVKAFAEKQKEFSSALSRLLVVSENYPQLKANENFLDLQRQLTGLEDQIAASRNRYIREVRDYNTVVRAFPTNLTAMMFDHSVKPQLALEDEAKKAVAPQVKF